MQNVDKCIGAKRRGISSTLKSQQLSTTGLFKTYFMRLTHLSSGLTHCIVTQTLLYNYFTR